MEDLNDEETFRLISQIVAGVRIHETEGGAFGSVLTQINRLTSRWQPTDETTTSTSQVMFALNPETSGWAAAGISETDAPTWGMLGFTPEYAQRWVAAGLDLTHAMKWSYLHGLKTRDPAAIAQWEAAIPDCEVNTVAVWLRSSVPAERAIAWTKAGGNSYTGREWLDAFPDHDPTDLFEAQKTGMTVSQVKQWLNRGVPGADIGAFIEKGYTPAAAKKELDAGNTPQTAKDKKGSALIPGRSWQRINEIIAKQPAVSCNIVNSNSHYTCTLTHTDRDPIEIRFRRNGQFAEARANRNINGGVGNRSYWIRRERVGLNELLTLLGEWVKPKK